MAYAGSRKELAESIGVTTQTITAWIKNGVISSDYAEHISDITGGNVSVDDLLGVSVDISVIKKIADESYEVDQLETSLSSLKYKRNQEISRICEENGVEFNPKSMSDEDLKLFDSLKPIYELIREVNKRRYAAKKRLKTAIIKYGVSHGRPPLDFDFYDMIEEVVYQ